MADAAHPIGNENRKLNWLYAYLDEREQASGNVASKALATHTCPCCGYPTLDELGENEICELCGWEDDGQADDTATELWGTNSDYSLREARENFKRYLTMYRPEDEVMFRRTRQKKTDNGRGVRDLVAVKKAITEKFDLISKVAEPDKLSALVGELAELYRKLF